MKYLSRQREKGGLSDLEKSAWYSRYMVEYLMAGDEKPTLIDELVKLNLKAPEEREEAEMGERGLAEPELLTVEDFAGID